MEAVVEFEYVAQEEDELSIKIGDIIQNVVKMDGGWWEGSLDSKRGMFPDNFVKEIKKEKEKTPPVKKQLTGGGGNSSHVAEMANRLATEGIKMTPGATKRNSTGPATVPPANRQSTGREQSVELDIKEKVFAKVTYEYTPQQKDELKLMKGETVEILTQDEEGWWEGSLNGKAGMFPSNFVEIIEDAKEEKTGESFHEIKGKKIKGVGLGNIFSEGPIKLRKAQQKSNADAHEEPTAAKREVTPDSEPKAGRAAPPLVPRDIPSIPPKEPKEVLKIVERAKVLYDYPAENEDELSLEEGDVLVVLDKELDDQGWWRGQLNGKTGVFPDNFVELLPPEEVNRPRKPPPPTVPPNQEKKVERPAPPQLNKTPEPPKKKKVPTATLR